MVLVWGVNYARPGNWVTALLFGLTLVIPILPEKIPVALSIIMALGAACPRRWLVPYYILIIHLFICKLQKKPARWAALAARQWGPPPAGYSSPLLPIAMKTKPAAPPLPATPEPATKAHEGTPHYALRPPCRGPRAPRRGRSPRRRSLRRAAPTRRARRARHLGQRRPALRRRRPLRPEPGAIRALGSPRAAVIPHPR